MYKSTDEAHHAINDLSAFLDHLALNEPHLCQGGWREWGGSRGVARTAVIISTQGRGQGFLGGWFLHGSFPLSGF